MKPSNFQLINKPVVTKCLFEVNKQFDFKGELSLEIDNNVQIAKAKDEELEAIVILNLGLFTKSDFEKVPFRMDITIEGVFQWDETIKEQSQQLKALLKENAPAILYGYLRPIITLMTVEGNLPPLVIPLMNFRR